MNKFEEDLIRLNKQNDKTWRRIRKHERKLYEKRPNVANSEMARIFFAIEDIEYANIRRKHGREEELIRD